MYPGPALEEASETGSGQKRNSESDRSVGAAPSAALLLQLLVEDRFTAIWMPLLEQRDGRALLLYRHQWVCIRTRVQNAFQVIALRHSLRHGSELWSKAGWSVDHGWMPRTTISSGSCPVMRRAASRSAKLTPDGRGC